MTDLHASGDNGIGNVEKCLNLLNRLEEIFISFLLGGMVLLTFTQVILRYIFDSGLFWALEMTSTLFAWLVLFGVSYVVKQGSHIGVDAFVNLFSPPIRRLFGLLAVAAAIGYSVTLLFGGYDYLSKMKRIGIPMEDIPVPIWVPYMVLPIGLSLILLRLLQITYRILKGTQESMLTHGEAEDALEQFSDLDKELEILMPTKKQNQD